MPRDLPKWMHRKHGGFYFVRHNKWTFLSRYMQASYGATLKSIRLDVSKSCYGLLNRDAPPIRTPAHTPQARQRGTPTAMQASRSTASASARLTGAGAV